MIFRGTQISKIDLIKAAPEASSLPEIKQNIHITAPPSEHLEAKPAPTAGARTSPSAKHLRASPSGQSNCSTGTNGYIKPRKPHQSENSNRREQGEGNYRAGRKQSTEDHRTTRQNGANGNHRERSRHKEKSNGKNFNEDFDFESNNALFDKKAVFEEIENGGGTSGAVPSNKHRHVSPCKQKGRNSPQGKSSRRKNNGVFNTQSSQKDSGLDQEFDFESNNALFNKEAVYEEIENGTAVAPSSDDTRHQPAKYGCHENVLQSSPVEFRQIQIDDKNTANDAKFEYVTDTGLIVPCIDTERRVRLMEAAEKAGLSRSRQIETVGRSVAEMVLQLCGGSHR